MMFADRKHLYLCVLVGILGHINISLGEQLTVTEASYYCALRQNNAKFGNIDDSCQTYFTCVNGVATKSSCPSGQLYDKDRSTCATASTVSCNGEGNACAGQSGFVSGASCREWLYCENGVAKGSGSCPLGQVFSSGACTYGECAPSNNPVLTSLCQIMPINVYFGTFDDCSAWQICKANQFNPTPGTCGANYAFDVTVAKCNTLSADLCTRISGPSSSNCDEETSYSPDTKTCSIYYVCTSGKWVRKSCATGVFDLISSTCKELGSALTTPTCDRCAFTTATFINAVDPTCNSYWYCINGEGTIGHCAIDYYFNGYGCTSSEPDVMGTGPCYACVCDGTTDKYGRDCDCTTESTSTDSSSSDSSSTESSSTDSSSSESTTTESSSTVSTTTVAADPPAGGDV